MDYSTVLSSASRLKKNSRYKLTIAEYTREILLQLNSKIMDAYDSGLSQLEYKLMINFPHVDDSVSNKEVQTAIYYKIVCELEKKEYDVKLRFLTNYTLLTVSWTVRSGSAEIKKMQDKLTSLCS